MRFTITLTKKTLLWFYRSLINLMVNDAFDLKFQ